MEYLQIEWTAAHREEGMRIAKQLIAQRLVACAHLLPITSIFRWHGQVEVESEVKVVLKTRPSLFQAVAEWIATHCSYAVPEIAAVPISACHRPYRCWLEEETER